MTDTQFDIFETPIWGYILSNEQYHVQDYINYILDLQQTTPSVKKSNFGGWQSKDDLNEHGIFQELSDVIKSLASDILKNYTDRPPYIQSMWANVNEKYTYNMTHSHEGELSGVFYLTIPEDSGKLVMVNPSVRSDTKVIRNKNYPIQPQNLACIMFPSWLEHYVEPNLSDKPRISMSFNIGVKE